MKSQARSVGEHSLTLRADRESMCRLQLALVLAILRCGRCGSGSWPAPPSPPRSSAWRSLAGTRLMLRPTAMPTWSFGTSPTLSATIRRTRKHPSVFSVIGRYRPHIDRTLERDSVEPWIGPAKIITSSGHRSGSSERRRYSRCLFRPQKQPAATR